MGGWRPVAAFAVMFVVCFFFAKQIYNVLVWPFVLVAGPENSKFIYTALLEYFITQLKLAMFGAAPGATALPAFALPEVLVIGLYFVLGFFFYSAMYAAAGALVASEQDTQQVQMPVTMLLLIGIVSFQLIANDPRGATSSALTQIPFWSPILMPMRFVLGGATLGEVAISLGILTVSTVLVVRIAGKIYRVGVLMYGKRPSLAEAIRWLRY